MHTAPAGSSPAGPITTADYDKEDGNKVGLDTFAATERRGILLEADRVSSSLLFRGGTSESFAG